MTCAHCQTDNPDGHSYCGKCGKPLKPAPAPGNVRYPDHARDVRRETVVILTGVLLLLAAAVGGWYALNYQRSPGMVVRRFINADRAGRYDDQQRYVSNRADSRFLLAAFQEFHKQSGVSLFQDYHIARVVEDGNTAFVAVNVTYTTPNIPGITPAGGPPKITSQMSFVLTYEEGQWRIDPTQTLAGAAGSALWSLLRPSLPGVPLSIPGLGAPGTSGQ